MKIKNVHIDSSNHFQQRLKEKERKILAMTNCGLTFVNNKRTFPKLIFSAMNLFRNKLTRAINLE